MKRTILLLGLLTSLHADIDMNDYTLEKQEFSQGEYFVKFGAFTTHKNAIKAQLRTNFPTKIIYMRDYFSLVSDEFQSRNEAQAVWKKIKKNHKDAYILKLYKKAKIVKPLPTEIKIVKQPSKQEKAIKLYNSRRYEEALMAFDMILIDTPNDINAKIYYAKTLYKLELFKEAKKEFELLSLSPLDAQTKIEMQSYLQAIERKQKRHFFNAMIGIGAGFDDNINLTTDAKTTEYGPYTLINDTNKTESTFGIASLSLSHRYLGESFSIYSSLYNYNEFAHTSDGNDLNFIDISSAFIKKYGNFSLSLPLGFNTSYLDGNEIGYNLYTNPSITYSINKELKTFVQGSFLDNTTKFAENRDFTSIGGSGGIKYTKEKFYGLFGVNIQNISAKEDLRFDVSKDVVSYFAQSRYQLFKTLHFGANGSFTNDSYTEMDSVMGYKREDDILRYGLYMGKSINKNSLLNFKYQHSKNDSNINAYSYDKNTYAVELKYRF